jgi:hypothetical protein
VLLRQSQHRLQFHSLTLVAVILWLGGFGCSLCCVKSTVMTQPEVEQLSQSPVARFPSEAESAKASCVKEEADCCKKRLNQTAAVNPSQTADFQAKQSDTALQMARPGGVVGCSLLPRHIPSLIVASPSCDVPDAVAEPVPITFAVVASTAERASTRPLLPHNRGGTRLRCCVFLI